MCATELGQFGTRSMYSGRVVTKCARKVQTCASDSTFPFILAFTRMSEPGKRFRFANWNAHSVLNKRQEIEAMLSLYDLDMLCVTETWITSDFVFKFFGYLTFRCDRRLGRGGGSLILIRSDLAVTRLDLTIPYGDVFEAVGLSVRSPLGDLAIICAYMPPNSGADLLAWRYLFASVPTGAAMLLCGDFNAHSGHWGSTLTNAAGRLISGLVSDFDLIPLNDSSPTFIAGPGKLCNNLDLVFLSASLFHLSSFYVGDHSFGSDHLPVFCSLDESLQRVRSASRRFNIKNLDWPGSRSRCDELARFLQPRLELGDDPKSIYGDFLTGVSSALEACGAYRPSFLRGKRKAQPLWWNPQCDAAIARRRSAIKAYLCDKTRLGKAEFRRVDE